MCAELKPARHELHRAGSCHWVSLQTNLPRGPVREGCLILSCVLAFLPALKQGSHYIQTNALPPDLIWHPMKPQICVCVCKNSICIIHVCMYIYIYRHVVILYFIGSFSEICPDNQSVSEKVCTASPGLAAAALHKWFLLYLGPLCSAQSTTLINSNLLQSCSALFNSVPNMFQSVLTCSYLFQSDQFNPLKFCLL